MKSRHRKNKRKGKKLKHLSILFRSNGVFMGNADSQIKLDLLRETRHEPVDLTD